MFAYFLTALLLFFTPLMGWQKEPTVAMKAATAPYLLTEEHPAKAILDQLFSKRVSTNTKTLEKAGFLQVRLLHAGQTVATHPSLPGFFLKLVLDAKNQSWSYNDNLCRKQDEYLEFVARIQRRNELQEIIDAHQITKIILPRKWIYPIPTKVDPEPGTIKKLYLLVAEDMHILPDAENLKKWKNEMTKEHLDELFLLMTSLQLSDINPSNLAFCEEEDILALIDTKPRPADEMKLTEIDYYLSPEMRDYWHSLIDSLRQ